MQYSRLKKRKEIMRVFTDGKRAYSATLTVVYTPSSELKMAVCVGKKCGKSVQRNHVKRLMREAFARFAGSMRPCAILLLPRTGAEYSFHAFERDLGKMLKKEGLIEG